MALTPIEFFAPSGLSLMLDLYLQSDSDTRVAAEVAIEFTNAKGYYFAVIADAVEGRCNAIIRVGSTPIGTFVVDMRDDGVLKRPLPQAQLDAIQARTDRIATGTLSVGNAGLSAAGDLTLLRGDSAIVPITVDADLTDAEELWLTAKRRADQEDADALVMLSVADGLLYVAGTAAADLDATQSGSLTITDAVAGTIELSISAAATAALPIVCRSVYDIQKRTAAGSVKTVGTGAFKVVADVTRTTGDGP
jgi:hypothetical protein